MGTRATEPRAWAVGHVTKDRIVSPGRADREQFGGSAYYVALAWASLGQPAGILTRMAAADAEVLGDHLAPHGVRLVNHPCASTTLFENRYEDEALARRTQRVGAIADPFEPEQIAALDAQVIHLGPLTHREISSAVVRAAVESGATVSLDAQGDLRDIQNERVVLAPVTQLHERLAGIAVLKVDDQEAAALVGIEDPTKAAFALAEHGAKEVLVTFADRGALLLANGRPQPISPRPPATYADATGCGDTFIAAYVFERAGGASPVASARFAAAAASLKLEAYGPLSVTADVVRAAIRSGA